MLSLSKCLTLHLSIGLAVLVVICETVLLSKLEKKQIFILFTGQRHYETRNNDRNHGVGTSEVGERRNLIHQV